MLTALHHVTLRSADLQRTLDFYHRLMGLSPGPRPPFSVPGVWLYAGERPLLHVLEGPVTEGAGAFDHVAFVASARVAISTRLREAAIPFQVHSLPDGSALQLVFADPDGARIELVFEDCEDR